jgi:Arm DNA-binding domain
MGKGVERLSALFPQRVKEPGLYGDGAGLWLQVSGPRDQPRKSWVYRYMLNGRARSMGLGPLYDVTLAEARELARSARRLARQGIDPIDARKSEKQARALEAASSVNFKAAAESFIALNRSSWKCASRARLSATIC